MKRRRKPRASAPPHPYHPDDPIASGAWPPGDAPEGQTTVEQGRDNVTAAGDHVATAPDLELGPSGGAPVDARRARRRSKKS